MATTVNAASDLIQKCDRDLVYLDVASRPSAWAERIETNRGSHAPYTLLGQKYPVVAYQ